MTKESLRDRARALYRCPHFCHRCPHIDGKIHPQCEAMQYLEDGATFERCECDPVCYKCERRAVARCGWPEHMYANTFVNKLRVGDICQNRSGNRTGRIIDLEISADGLSTAFTIERIYKKASPYGGGRVDTYTWPNHFRVVKLFVDAPCGKPACEAHHRDLIGGAICAAHWPNQLELIA